MFEATGWNLEEEGKDNSKFKNLNKTEIWLLTKLKALHDPEIRAEYLAKVS